MVKEPLQAYCGCLFNFQLKELSPVALLITIPLGYVVVSTNSVWIYNIYNQLLFHFFMALYKQTGNIGKVYRCILGMAAL